MRKFLKWSGIFVAGLVSLLLIAGAVLILQGNGKLNRQYEIETASLDISTDTAVLARGEYLATASCAGCHGPDFGGTPFFDDPALGRIPAPNLTSGAGGLGAAYTTADFVRAIRHGVDPEGRPLMIMPSSAFWYFSDEDLAAIVAYVQNAPPVDNDPGQRELKPVGRLLVGAGILDVLAADAIAHDGPRPTVPAPRVGAGYGEYLVNVADCRACHGVELAGGQPPEPGAPPGPDLTPSATLSSWTASDFIKTMRTGVNPVGRQLNGSFMPWEEYGRLNDDDLQAIFIYLQSLPASP